MKKLLAMVSLLILTNLYAHTLIMNLIDNENDTVTVVGEFSTGQKAADAMIRIEALHNGNVLFQQRLPNEGELTISIPKEPYQVVLDGGPGHQIVKEGVVPQGGYVVSHQKEKIEKKKLSQAMSSKNTWSLPYTILISITLLLIGLTVYFSKKNTDKILKMIQEKK